MPHRRGAGHAAPAVPRTTLPADPEPLRTERSETSPATSETPATSATEQAQSKAAAQGQADNAAQQGAAGTTAQRTPAAYRASAALPAAARPAKPRQTALALFGSGAPTSSGRSEAGSIVLSDSFQYTFSGSSPAAVSDDLSARRRADYAAGAFDHRQPWSLGLTLRHRFGHGLAIESGLLYTQLRSEVTIRGYGYDQRLHLLGVPLRLTWSFVDRPKVGLYLGGGGMVERCIRARLGEERVEEKDLQVSLAALFGAEYRFSRIAALYAEPELAHYLTQTRLRTIRTDHPLAFSLRVGVRFTF